MEENMNSRNIYICFPGGRHKALTLSYDDGRREDQRLVALLNQYGLKGTFHLNSGLTNDERRIPQSDWKDLYQGHEVACHTVLHPTMARMPVAQAAVQVLEDRNRLEEIVGYPVRGMSYPNGSYTEEIRRLLPSLGIEYCRIVGDSHGYSMPEDYFTWKSTCHHNHQLMEHAREFTDLFQTQYLFLMYVWGHSYEFESENNWELIEEFCRTVSGRTDIWYATNIQIVDYMNAAKALKFTVSGNQVWNPGAEPVWIEVDRNIVKVPGGECILLVE